MDDPFLVSQCAGYVTEVADGHRVDEIVGCSIPVDLDKIGPGGVPKATRSLCIDGKRARRVKEVVERSVKICCVLDEDDRSMGGGGRQGSCVLDVLAHELARLGGRVATPSCVGGKPASMHTNSLQASRWGPMVLVVGLQEALTSTRAPEPSDSISPKPVETTDVVVPAAWE
jgi:hypothetical protein